MSLQLSAAPQMRHFRVSEPGQEPVWELPQPPDSPRMSTSSDLHFMHTTRKGDLPENKPLTGPSVTFSETSLSCFKKSAMAFSFVMVCAGWGKSGGLFEKDAKDRDNADSYLTNNRDAFDGVHHGVGGGTVILDALLFNDALNSAAKFVV